MLKADDVRELNPAVERAMNALKFVAQHVKNEDKFESVRFSEFFDPSPRNLSWTVLGQSLTFNLLDFKKSFY